MELPDFQNSYLPFYQKWLNNQPLPEEVKENDDGSKYIPIEYVKPKLDYISPTWGTTNFQHHYTEMPVYDKAGNQLGITLWASGSVELNLFIKEEKKNPLNGDLYTVEEVIVCRTLTGSATFDVQKYYPNSNWSQTLLSLCIVAAAKELGPTFGKDLNKETLTMPTNSNHIKKRDKIANTIKHITNQ